MGRAGILTEAQCRKVLGELLEKVTGENLHTSTTRQFLTDWLEGKVRAKAEGTSLRYGNTVKLFLDGLGRRASLSISAVAPRDIERFRDAQLAVGKAPSTVNVDLKTLRSAFNLARRQGHITTNPVDAIELPDEQRHGRSAFTADQIKALVGAAEGEWKTAIRLGRYTGCRIGDAVSMTWENIKLDGDVRTITYAQGKTGRTIVVPIHPDLESHLLALAGDDPTAPLTPTLAKMEVGGRTGLSRQFKDIMTRARIDDGRIEPEREDGQTTKGRAFSKLSFHSLRHAFVSDLANAGVTEELRMKLSGHTTESSHQLYTKLQLRTLADAINKLPSLEDPQQ
jgi:integrase